MAFVYCPLLSRIPAIVSTELITLEIRRFLASPHAQAICIKGRWGIGKTYAWRHHLREALQSGRFHRQNYAYVSMFGLSSLDDLRYAIFESTVPPENVPSGPDAETFGKLVNKAKSLGRQTRSWIGPALSSIALGEIGNALARSAFLLVRNQLICLDDLERASAGLEPRDVLGLISFLKEERNCRVVLLLNDEAMEKEKKNDFDRLLEKVIDTSLVFAPTAAEAAALAIQDDEPIGAQLRQCIQTLGITNIRIIKKIERFALQLAELLQPYRSEILARAVTACTLFGWAVYEPDSAPSPDFVRNYNSVTAALLSRDSSPPEEFVRWRDKFLALPFSNSNDFDRVIFEGVAVGYFDRSRLLSEAEALEEVLKRDGRNNSFARAWDRYHGSLKDDDDVVLNAIRQGALENLTIIDPVNINAAILFLREFGRDTEADDLARSYTRVLPDDPYFFDLKGHHFSESVPIDSALNTAFTARELSYKDERDPKDVLLLIGRGGPWQKRDIRLLAQLSPNEFEALVFDTEGEDLRIVVQTALKIAGRHAHDAPTIKASLYEALSRIAAKSPMRARRLKAWGFTALLPKDENSESFAE